MELVHKKKIVEAGQICSATGLKVDIYEKGGVLKIKRTSLRRGGDFTYQLTKEKDSVIARNAKGIKVETIYVGKKKAKKAKPESAD